MTATDPALAAEEAAFMAAIVRAPDDDVPRLVFADWLEEHGQPVHFLPPAAPKT